VLPGAGGRDETAARDEATARGAGQTLAVRARDLGLVGDHGRVYGPLDLDIPRGGLTVLRGHPGNGRTCLLLTLAGRMKPTEGTVEVFGETAPHRIFHRAAIAGFSDIDTLDPAVTVRALVGEQRAWMSPWWRPRTPTGASEIAEVLGPVYGDARIPGPKVHVGDLTELDRMLVRIALARWEGAPMLVVDDLEQVRVDEERSFLLGRLDALVRSDGVTVVVSSVDDLPPGSPAHELVTVPATKEGLA